MKEDLLKSFLDFYIKIFGVDKLGSYLFNEIKKYVGEKLVEYVKKRSKEIFGKLEILFLSDEKYFSILQNNQEKKMELIQTMNSLSDEKKELLIFCLYGVKDMNIKNGKPFFKTEIVSFIVFQKKEFFKNDFNSNIIFCYNDINLFRQKVTHTIDNISQILSTNILFSAVLLSIPDDKETISFDGRVVSTILDDDEVFLNKVA